VAKRKKTLLYKVVELSAVDEATLEQAVNAWVQKGWALDGIQFAMRDSSKRPSMAFVFFTRMGYAAAPHAETPHAPARARVSAFERLEQLAHGGDEP
jgi:type 1 glutamine amidotransferase